MLPYFNLSLLFGTLRENGSSPPVCSPHSLWTHYILDHSGTPCTARAALPVASAVPANHQVLGLIATRVKVEVILWHQIHVVEYETVPVFLLESLQIAHIQELGSIKLLTSSLLRMEIENESAPEINKLTKVLPLALILEWYITLVPSQDNTH